jgi:2-succinyl-6-hydroxy-2,4-cyclohexadiene-1-carboxylate synthase
VRLNGLDFHVEIEGEGNPIVLLHGFTGSVRSWDGVRPALANCAQVIALDLIGHGQSAAPHDAERYSLAWSARDVLALLDGLNLDSVSLLGYSMGGRVALHCSVQAPARVRTLILESASPGIEDALERQRRRESDEALAERILERGVPGFVAEWERQPLLALAKHVSEEDSAYQHAQRLQNNALGLANSLRGMGAGQQQPLWSHLPELSLPVQLIVGERDARYRTLAERARALLPSAELAVVKRAGHTVHLDQPTDFVRVVTDVIADRARCR